MMEYKIIQDPVHGYIHINDTFMNIVDSKEFQRLKWIEQGSFRVLYPGARHDRFIHSLGTFYLAQKAGDSFFENIKEDLPLDCQVSEDDEIKLKNTFLYAALLHDIGHAPFSHTCEGYFKLKKVDGSSKIDLDLINAIKYLDINEENKDKFQSEYNDSEKASPHEIVSATLLLKNAEYFLGQNLKKIDIELAARMVIGLTYNELNNEYGIKNCLIRLLNSKTVDVDKLDYICRDTKMTGFSNVTIDIERITKGVTAVIDGDDLLPAFRKNTLSVIDNVFRAKEEQGKWVISHPVVVYESELIKQCINEIDSKFKGYIDNIFTYESLGKEGVSFNNKNYKLLSDIDILSDLKANIDLELINEYFFRECRRKAVWKSYQEYEYMVTQSIEKKCLDKFYQYFSPLINYMNINGYFILNDDLKRKILQTADEKVKNGINLLKEITDEAGVDFDFVLLEVKNSFATKISRDEVYIKFSEVFGEKIYTYNDLNAEKESNIKSSTFFYLFSKQKIKKKFFVDKLDFIMRNLRRV